jgi:hypothetical protein
MRNPTNEIIETRLNMWKVFFETGRDTLPPNATAEIYDVDAVIDSAIESRDGELMGLAELVDLMAQNYILKADNADHGAMMQDDPTDSIDYAPSTRTGGSVTMAELDAVLAGA